MVNPKKEVIVFNQSKIGWTFIDTNQLFHLFRVNNINYLPLDEITKSNDSLIKFDDLHIDYKSISLFDVCVYNICNELQIFKNEIDLEIHSEILNKWYNVAVKTIDYLHHIYEDYEVKGTIVFHGHLLFEACLLAVSKKYQVKFLTLENTFNKGKITWDNISGYVVTYNLARNYFNRYRNFLDKNVIEQYCDNYIKNIHSYKREEHQSETKSEIKLPFANNYILFICQVYNDASLLFSLGDGFKNPIEIIEKTQSIAEKNGFNLVIKLHPKEVLSMDPVTKRTYNEPTLSRLFKITDKENVFIDTKNEYDTYKLINESRAVVTVNSQAGVEASLFDKPVFTYKNCFYSNLGFTYDYDNSNSLEYKLNTLIANESKTNKNSFFAKLFFYIYFEKFCIDRSAKFVFRKFIESTDLELKNKKDWIYYKKRVKSVLKRITRKA